MENNTLKREIKNIPKNEDEKNDDHLNLEGGEQQLKQKKRGRPKKIIVDDTNENKTKKSVGRPKSELDIKTRRILYGLTYYGKDLGLTEDEIKEKKKDLLNKLNNK